MTCSKLRPGAVPMTAAEMIERYRDGDAVDEIAGTARRRNGLTKDQVRAILFGSGPERAS